MVKAVEITEGWSAKYKRSINCSNPKGFSQKAHCAGRKKNESQFTDLELAIMEGGHELEKNSKQGVTEGFSNDMSTEDMIAYLRQHHDKNLHQDYLNHITSTNSKFVLKNIPINSIKTELSGLDRAKVEQYKQMDFSKAPPIVVGSDGNILDGYHRATVAKALGIPTIRAYVGVKGQQGVTENFADGKVKGKSRPGRVKRAGASCEGSVTDLRAKAKKYSGEKGKMYHWCANMKGGKK